MLDFINPNWPAPPWIKAVATTRQGGFSSSPFDSLNLGQSVGDTPDCVVKNKRLLKASLGLTQDLLWLKQVHGTKVIAAIDTSDRTADAVYTNQPQTVCAVLTADCLPLLVCSKTRPCVAAIHAGWKGLLAGVLENTIKVLTTLSETKNLLVWLGPAIGPQAFIVGEAVFLQFMQKSAAFEAAFTPISDKKWLANIYQLAKLHLHKLGITAIYGGQHCTYTEKERFFSFRRDTVTGRMATLIWIK